MGEGGLDEDSGHEAEGASGAGVFDFDLERLLGEFAALLRARDPGTGTAARSPSRASPRIPPTATFFPPVSAEAFFEDLAQTFLKPGFRVQEVSHWTLDGP